MFKRVHLHDPSMPAPYLFKEVFEIDLGQTAHFKAVFGRRGWREDNPTDLEIVLQTPAWELRDIRFDASDQNNMGGDRVLILSEKSGAEPGDEGVIACNEHHNGNHRAGGMSLFVNVSGIDPKPTHLYSTTVREMQFVPRTTWLKPDSIYYLRLYRTNVRSDGKHPPMSIMHTCLP